MSRSDSGKCSVKLTMNEHRYAKVKNRLIKSKALAAVEGGCICKSKRKLSTLHGSGAVAQLKFKINPRQAKELRGEVIYH